MDKEAWNTRRKIWHMSGCLAMLPVYFMWRGLEYPASWLVLLMTLGWLLAGLCVAIDITRLYLPSENHAFKCLPFYGSILRQHEHSGYNASTYCFLTVAILLTGAYFGFVSESVLITAIVIMAMADPVAALFRVNCYKLGSTAARAIGAIAYAGAACLSAIVIFHLLGAPKLNYRYLLVASCLAALAEAYLGNLWQYCQSRLPNFKLPLFMSIFYPDDNLVAPLTFAVALMFYGL